MITYMNDWYCKECGTLLRKCATCGKPFPVGSGGRRPTQLYCGKKCARLADWKNPETRRKAIVGHSGKNNYKWRPVGSKKKSYSSKWTTEYWKVKCEDGRWRWEHRVIMEKILGRKLSPDEHVHHKDENGLNNKPSNLEVMSIGDHLRLHHKGKPKPRR